MLTDFISSSASSTNTSTLAWVGAVASFAGAILGAGLGGVLKLAGERRARQAESQRQALYAVLDGVEAIQGVLAEIGTDVMTTEQTKTFDAAKASWDNANTRVSCEIVRDQCRKWFVQAKFFYLGADEGSAAAETTAQASMRAAVMKELRRFDA